jgi:hypothetical protein
MDAASAMKVPGSEPVNGPATVGAAISRLPKAAKMAAVEILLVDPESLQDDVLESCLYIRRERLSAEASEAVRS